MKFFAARFALVSFITASLYSYEWKVAVPETGVIRYLSAATDGDRVVLGGLDGQLVTTTDFVTFTDVSIPTNLDIRQLSYRNGAWGALAANSGFFGSGGARQLDGVPLFSHDGIHWTFSVPPGFDDDSRVTSLGAGPQGWLFGSGLNQSDQPIGYLTRNGIDWETITFATENTTGSPWINHLAYKNDTWMGFAGNGAFRSADGRNWLKVEGSPALGNSNDSAFANGTWLVLTGGLIHASTDHGDTWQSLPLGASINGLAALDDTFYAVGEKGAIYYSANGINWAQVRNVGTNFLVNDLTEIIAFKGKIYAMGEGGLILEADPADRFTWNLVDGRSTKLSFEVGSFKPALAYDGDTFVAIGTETDGSQGLSILMSADGENWALADRDPDASIAGQPIAGNGVTLFFGNAFDAQTSRFVGQLFRFENGALSSIATPSLNASNLTLAGFANGLFFMSGSRNHSNGQDIIVFTSTDGVSWTERLVMALNGFNVGRGPIQVVHTGSDYYLFFDENYDDATARVFRSSDLTIWTPISTNLPGGDQASLAFGNGRFVVTSGSSGTRYSDDGEIYFSASGPPSGGGVDGFRFVASNGSRFFLVTESSYWVSEDGINFENFAEDQSLRFTAGQFLAAEGKLLTLADEYGTGSASETIVVAEDTAHPAPEINFIGQSVKTAGGFQTILLELSHQPLKTIEVAVKDGGATLATATFSPINVQFSGGAAPLASATIASTSGSGPLSLTLQPDRGAAGEASTFTLQRQPSFSTRTYRQFQEASFTVPQIEAGLANLNVDAEPDGAVNAFEHLFDFNPLAPDAILPVIDLVAHPTAPSSLQAIVSVPRLLGSTDVRFELEASTDLVNYAPVFGESVSFTTLPGTSEFGQYEFKSIPLPTTGSLYIRYRASLSGDNGFGGSSSFTGSDNFNTTSINAANWQAIFPQGPLPSGLSFGQDNGQLRLSGSAGQGQEGFAALQWNQPIPLDESWQAEIEYSSGSISLGSNNRFVGAGIILLSELTESGVQVSFEYARDPQGVFSIELGGNETKLSGAANSGTLRLRWDAESRQLVLSQRPAGSFDFIHVTTAENPFDIGLTEVFLIAALSAENATLNNPLALDNFTISTPRNP